MDAAFTLKHENPKSKANIISKLFFGWIVRLFYRSIKGVLKLEDLYKVLEYDSSEHLGNKLEQKWCEETLKRKKQKDYKPSLLKAILRVFGYQYIIYGVYLSILQIALRSPQPVALAGLIRQFQGNTVTNRTTMYATAGVLVSISTLVIFFIHHIHFGERCVGMRIRIAASSLVYRKIMKLNKSSQMRTATGHVVNLLSNDVQRFDEVCTFLHYLWIMPFQIALVTYFLWNTVGVACLAGIVSMVLCTLPLQGYLGKLASSLRRKVAERTDARVKLMSEIISGIQVIKMYAWENPFQNLIAFLRTREVNVLTKTSYLRGFYLSCIVFIERSALFITVICYVLLGNDIRADIVFSMAQFFNILQAAMAIYYPMAISLGAEALVSIKRLEEFLLLEEKQEDIVEKITDPEAIFRKITASWVSDDTVLNKIDLHLPKGCLCAIVGPVGSGKSSLLQKKGPYNENTGLYYCYSEKINFNNVAQTGVKEKVLLGELPPSSGNVSLGGNISYSSQEPWLFAASIKKNILLGRPYDSDLYRKVTHVCALERDFEQFPFGDETVVGDRGVSLSGGQRARINLARAIYKPADVYLLDDPLSAVDTHVGKHLFEKCIVEHLKGKTRILVTHQLQYLKKSDFIVILNEGRIEATGTLKDILKSKLNFSKMLTSAGDSGEEKDKQKQEIEPIEDSCGNKKKLFNLNCATNSSEQTIEDEENEVGISDPIDRYPLWEYVKSVANFCLVITVAFILIISQTACTGTDLWVALWTRQEELRHLHSTQIFQISPIMDHVVFNSILNSGNSSEVLTNNSSSLYTIAQNDSQPIEGIPKSFMYHIMFDTVNIDHVTHELVKTNVAMYIYGGFIILTISLTIVRSFLFFKSAMRSSKNIHSQIIHCLLETPMRFFDANPSGRILNRFSKDMGGIDEVLPRVLLDSIQIILVMCGILVTVIISNYYMVLPTILLGGMFFKMRTWYVVCAKRIKHLEGIAKSPVFSHINSSINGLTTIRAARAENILIKEFDEHQNVHTSAWFLTIMCSVSFGLWLDIICVIFIATVTFGFVIAADYNVTVNGSLIGLAVSQSLILTGMLQYGMKQTVEVVNELTSVERVLQYTKLNGEGPFETPKDTLTDLKWPSFGKIEFRNLNLTYIAGQLPTLKNLNMLIQQGEKVGIVGRTGAGKSSLISALFRLAPLEGQILIDEVDTKTIGLIDLRKNISIIPQQPVLFSATLRYNLDPFNEFGDDELWSALEQVELKDLVTSLDFQVSEGGANFSLGQRQLLCLARALLRNNKILVLDEATANVDARTDGFIQTTIRKKFADCTVLTIAHRVNTIMDSDKVLLMSAGEILEFDHPFKLLEKHDGHFTKMVEEMGPSMTELLRDVAFKAWKGGNEESIEVETTKL